MIHEYFYYFIDDKYCNILFTFILFWLSCCTINILLSTVPAQCKAILLEIYNSLPCQHKTCYILLVKIKRYLKIPVLLRWLYIYSENEHPNSFAYLSDTVCQK